MSQTLVFNKVPLEEIREGIEVAGFKKAGSLIK